MGIIIKRDAAFLQSAINRIKASLEQVKTSDHFTEKDRETLIPFYEQQLTKHSAELALLNKSKGSNQK